MGQLPFLVVHGAVVWKLVWVGLVALTYVVAYALRQRRARRLARAAVAQQTVSSPTRGPIVVRGRIKTGTATTTSQFATFVDTRSDALSLDCDGTLVEIVGPVRVEQGATTNASWTTKVVRRVAVGDEVIAVGTMGEGPTEAGSYRDGTPTWHLHAPEAVQLLATVPRARATPLSIGQHVGALLAIATLWLGALYVVGNRMLAHAEDQRANHLDGDLPAYGATEIAAAMPGSRDGALSHIESQLTFIGHARSEAGLQQQLALRGLQNECPALLLLRTVRLEPALAAARTCEPRLVPYILAFEGRFDEAEAALVPNSHSEDSVEIHIATGHWTAAAAGAEERATRLELAQRTNTDGARYLHEAAIEARCTAALFRSFGGDHDAFAKLDHGRTGACAIIEAATLPIADQVAAFSAIPEPTDTETRVELAGYDTIADELGVAAGANQTRYPSHTGVTAMMFSFEQKGVWLAPFQLAAHPDDTSTEVAHQNMVAFAAISGDLAAAREHLSHVTDADSHSTLSIAVSLRDGSPLELGSRRDFTGQDEAIALRTGKIDGKIQPYLDDHDGDAFRADLQRAAAGDGRGLAAALESPYLQWQAFAAPMLGLLPRITTQREQAISALRTFRNELGTYDTTRIPFDVVSDDALYRDAARLIGDTEDAKQWQIIIDRYATVLRDRQRLVAFVFWRK